MNNTILNARTVTVVRDLRVEKRQGVNGEFESKDILVRIAVDRDYKVTRTENGKTISEYPTDFWLAKFTGAVAQVFADHCTSTKEDGKLVSRHLLLSGNFENYTNTRKVKGNVHPQVNINGQLYQLDLEVELDAENNSNTIFVVDSMKFLDKNPNGASTTGSTSNVTVTSATPVTPAPVAPVAGQSVPVQNVAVQPVQSVATTPVQVVPQNQPIQVAQTVDMSQAMTPPVIDPNFVPTGQTAPF